MIDYNNLFEAYQNVKKQSPLVHNITNYVVMNNTANALLAVGASPVMAHAVNEVEDMASIASSLVINIGTLSDKWIDAMILAGKRAKERGIPIILDPVGVGATKYRTETAKKIIEECQPTIIRGNASEIMALNNADIKTKGVDSTESTDSALAGAKKLAKKLEATVVISGEVDYVTDGEQVISVQNGDEMMAKVTGMGCSASAIIGAFASFKDALTASAEAMAIMGIVGEIAASKSEGPGSMQLNFLDELYILTSESIKNRLNIQYD